MSEHNALVMLVGLGCRPVVRRRSSGHEYSVDCVGRSYVVLEGERRYEVPASAFDRDFEIVEEVLV